MPGPANSTACRRFFRFGYRPCITQMKTACVT